MPKFFSAHRQTLPKITSTLLCNFIFCGITRTSYIRANKSVTFWSAIGFCTIPKSRMSHRPVFPTFSTTLGAVDADRRDAKGRLSMATLLQAKLLQMISVRMIPIENSLEWVRFSSWESCIFKYRPNSVETSEHLAF